MIQRYKRPDKKNAESLLEAAKKDIDYTLTLTLTDEAAATITRNIYESFRKLGEALLLSQGKEANDHVQAIQELFTLKLNTERPIKLLENLKRLRHNINYYGYSPSLKEVEDVISFSKSCYTPTHKAVKEKIQDMSDKDPSSKKIPFKGRLEK